MTRKPGMTILTGVTGMKRMRRRTGVTRMTKAMR